MIDISLALIVAILLPFICAWIMIACVTVTLWLVPFSALCIIEVGRMCADVFKTLLRPLVWIARLIGRIEHARHTHLSVSRHLFRDGSSQPLHRLPTGPGRG